MAASKTGKPGSPSLAASAAPTPNAPGAIGRIRRVVAGSAQTCVLSSEGIVRCAGLSRYEHLAPGSPPDAVVAEVALQGRVVDIATGNSGTCAVLDNGAVTCWGGDYRDYKTNRAMLIPSVSGAKAIFMDQGPTCAIVEGGDVACWGTSSWANTRGDTNAVRLGLRDVTSVAPAERYACVTHQDGKASCKGHVPWADKPSEEWFTVEPPRGAGATSFTRVSAAFGHACFETAAGAPVCLGGNDDRKITGDAWNGEPETSGKLPGFAARVRRIAARAQRTCAIDAAGRVGCWGRGYYGEVGVDPDAPVLGGIAPIPSLVDVVDIALADSHTCALESDGDVYCWGHNTEGQLGDGSPIYRNAPVDVGVFEDVEEIRGERDKTCLLRQGAITCWGSTRNPGPWPAQVPMEGTVRAMDLEQNEVCGLLNDGTVRCGLFHKTTRCHDVDHKRFCADASSFASDALPGLPGKPTDLAIDHLGNVCALVGGAGYCLFHEGESGTYYKGSWQRVPGVSGATAIEASSDAMCFILGGPRGVACFKDYRFEGDQDFAQGRPQPKLVGVPSTSKVDALVAGQTRFCLLSGGSVACFDTGEGSGPPGRWPSPGSMQGLPRADAIAGSGEKFCAIHEGKVSCWAGSSEVSELSLPSPARRIGVGENHACAWTADKHLYCWGHDDGGQLGGGRVAMSYRPIRASALLDAKRP